MIRRRFLSGALLLAAGVLVGLPALLGPAAVEARSIIPAPLLREPLLPISVGPGIEVGRLTVFPVLARGKVRTLDVLTLDQAMKSGRLVITENKRARVRSLTAVNKSDRAVFVMAGEMIVGARQDRMVGRDVLIPPRTTLKIPVYCVEKRRWKHVSRKFSTSAQTAPQEVRSLAYARASQGRVWKNVDRVNRRVGAAPRTATLQAAYRDPKVRAKIKKYQGRLNRLPRKFPNQVGVVIAVKGRFLAADVFGTPGLFARMWPKLVKSYALDAAAGSAQGPELTGPQAAAKVLHDLDRSWFSITKGVGLGWNREARQGILGAHALFALRTVVHLAAFLRAKAVPVSGYRPGRIVPRHILNRYQQRGR
jgi:hypothetical protein